MQNDRSLSLSAALMTWRNGYVWLKIKPNIHPLPAAGKVAPEAEDTVCISPCASAEKRTLTLRQGQMEITYQQKSARGKLNQSKRSCSGAKPTNTALSIESSTELFSWECHGSCHGFPVFVGHHDAPCILEPLEWLLKPEWALEGEESGNREKHSWRALATVKKKKEEGKQNWERTQKFLRRTQKVCWHC